MYANDLALGRNHFTADSAKLVTFHDCARSELHWNDGAYVYELFDTAEEAIKNLNRLGFYAENKTNEEKTMNSELKQAIADLKAAHAAFAAGTLKPVQHGDARQAALIKGVVALAAGFGVTLEPIHRIDARGELYLVAKQGTFGAQFSKALTIHCRPRQGVIPGATMTDTSTWCYINHFDAEAMVLAYLNTR